jgi:acyl dehydratase
VDRYFEDYQLGKTYEYTDTITVDEQRITEFAREFDPQPFHVDPDEAAAGPFGGLIASGWHTAGIMMRLLAENYLSPASSLGSPGIDEIRWPAPVRPGDTLRIRATVASSRRSRTKPDRGVIHTRIEVLNQRDDIVMSLLAINLLRLRHPDAETDESN